MFGRPSAAQEQRDRETETERVKSQVSTSWARSPGSSGARKPVLTKPSFWSRGVEAELWSLCSKGRLTVELLNPGTHDGHAKSELMVL